VGNKIRLQTFPLEIFFALGFSGLVFSLLSASELVRFHVVHSLNFYFILIFFFIRKHFGVIAARDCKPAMPVCKLGFQVQMCISAGKE